MINLLKNAALEGGEILKNGFSQTKSVHKKGAVDLLTQYDLAVESCVKEALSKSLPGWEIVAEESGGTAQRGKRIFIDPIDGTTNFVHGHPFCCVSIGAWEDETPVAGVVYAPLLNELYTAEAGKGAFCNGEKICVNDRADLRESLLSTGFPYSVFENEAVTKQVEAWLFKALRSSQGVRRCGAAAIDLAHVAKGIYAGFWEMGLKSWDVATGILLIREAGGKITTLDGQPFGVQSGDIILATNGRIHDELKELLTAGEL